MIFPKPNKQTAVFWEKNISIRQQKCINSKLLSIKLHLQKAFTLLESQLKKKYSIMKNLIENYQQKVS
jgi:hypothetical protein